MVDPLNYFSFQPVHHDRLNKGRGMCYPVSFAANRKDKPMWRQRVSSLAIWVVLYHMSDAI